MEAPGNGLLFESMYMFDRELAGIIIQLAGQVFRESIFSHQKYIHNTFPPTREAVLVDVNNLTLVCKYQGVEA